MDLQVRPKRRAPDVDPFFGRGLIAGISARFIAHSFGCSLFSRISHPRSHLMFFVATVLHDTRFEDCAVYAALVLLLRLKTHFPHSRGTSGHRLFLAAFMVSSKVLGDRSYTNAAWMRVAGNLCTLREINEMELDLCSRLDWHVSVQYTTILDLSVILVRNFSPHSAKPWPSYRLCAFPIRKHVSSRAEMFADDTPAGTSRLQEFILVDHPGGSS
ncbi:hypothetical protein C8R46DRAFT_879315 [Mycena filopes]|nr:hypothetical protein C8R46DRAFT_879315 [Mycena filopes]